MLGMVLCVGLLAAATPAIVEQQGAHVLVVGPVIAREVRYGPAERQTATLFVRVRAGRAPLIVYLHGGGWSAGTQKAGSGAMQAEHWTSLGYAYATVGYRLVPGATAEQQMEDVAHAIAALRRVKTLDPDRIALIGHSSGAQMAALAATDPHWLADAEVPFATLKAVILLDPSALDLPTVLAAHGNSTVERYFRPAFGDDPARQSTLSPTKNVEPPNAPFWLVVADENNGFAKAEGAQLVAGLIGAGAKEASLRDVAGTTHLRLNDEIGRPGDEATAEIDAFLTRAFPDATRATALRRALASAMAYLRIEPTNK